MDFITPVSRAAARARSQAARLCPCRLWSGCSCFSPLCPPPPPALRSTGQVITSLLVCVQPQEAAPAKSPQSSERSKTTVSKQCSPIPTSSRAFIGSYHLFISELELRQTHADRRAAPPSSTMPPPPPHSRPWEGHSVPSSNPEPSIPKRSCRRKGNYCQ